MELMTKMSAENKTFFKLLFGISMPIMIQEFIYSSLSMIDVLMIGKLGSSSITGVGLANQIFFLFSLLMLGINSGASIFMAQYWGKRDIEGIHKIMGISIFLSVFAGLLFAFVSFFTPELVMSIYSKDPAVIEEGAKYLKVVAFSYVFNAITKTLSYTLRSIEAPSLTMVVSFFAVILNTLLNYMFIFGKLGAPEMGVVGAALATLIARIFEAVVVILFMKKLKYPINAKLKQYFSVDKKTIKMFFGTAGVVILNEIVWSIGTSLYNVAYKYAGTEAQTAIQITSNFQNMFLVVILAVGSATAIMLGNLLGANQLELAQRYEKKFFIAMIVLGIVCGVVLFFMKGFLLSFFKISPIEYEYCDKILNVLCFMIFPKALNFLYIVGVLRSGGDTKYALMLDLSTVWFIGVPMAFLGTLVFQLPIYWVYFLVLMEEPVKLFFSFKRARTKKWVKVLT